MYNNHFNKYFDPIYFCVFIKKFEFEFIIIVVYVNDLNIIKTYEKLSKVVEYLKMEFEMKGHQK